MSHVQLFNLQRQYQTLTPKILSKWQHILETTQFTSGQELETFETNFADFCQVKYAVGTRSGTASLVVALKAAGIQPGDEVITTPVTFSATADAIVLVGATPVFADVEPSTGNLDPLSVISVISKKTKAILVVHVYGVPVDLNAFLALAKKYKLHLIEDASHAHGSLYQEQPVGSFGLAGCFSLYPSKTLGAAGNAGVVTSNNKIFSRAVRMAANHGVKPGGDKYTHFISGYNELMDNVQAAALNVKLPLLPMWIKRKKEIAQLYNQAFVEHNHARMEWSENCNPSLYVYAIQVKSRQRFQEFMKSKSIETGVYYPTPLHRQPSMTSRGYRPGSFPKAERFMRQTVSLPLYPELTASEVEQVVASIHAYFR